MPAGTLLYAISGRTRRTGLDTCDVWSAERAATEDAGLAGDFTVGASKSKGDACNPCGGTTQETRRIATDLVVVCVNLPVNRSTTTHVDRRNQQNLKKQPLNLWHKGATTSSSHIGALLTRLQTLRHNDATQLP